jgi:glycosyltransferase involved in cell wall biosynthesis
MRMWTVLFAMCALGSVYSYALYPLVLLLLPKRPVGGAGGPSAETPIRVSLIIACRNEERRIEHKLENALAIRYPELEILVASDASDDGSEAIVARFADRGVRLVRSAVRRGKEHAQHLAVEAASGEILVFSDAGTDTPPDSIDHIVESFGDPRVGAVSSEDRFVTEEGEVVGEGAYVRYEMWLRRLESATSSLVGLSGSFFAVRRRVAESWDDAIPSDFACAINAYRAGLVAIADPRVVGLYKDIKDPSREFERKVRTALRGMAALGRIPEVLNPFRYGLFSFQVWSHKVMRWLVPWFLVGLLVSNLLLVGVHPAFAILFLLQLGGYTMVLLAHVAPRARANTLVRLGYFFVQANAALLTAGVQYLAGVRVVTWNPSVR